MGLLDRWSKKTDAERLEKTAPKASEKAEKAETKTVKASEEKTKKTSAKVAKTTSKTSAKKAVKTVEAEVVNTTNEDKKVLPKKSINSVLVRALVTEKTAGSESKGKYVFVVKNDANKAAVINAVYSEYKVKPVKVNIINMMGKVVRYGRSVGRRSDFKKAIVTLPKGKTIAVHQGV